MAHWNSRGLRGSSFEEIINFTNERYRQSGLAEVKAGSARFFMPERRKWSWYHIFRPDGERSCR